MKKKEYIELLKCPICDNDEKDKIIRYTCKMVEDHFWCQCCNFFGPVRGTMLKEQRRIYMKNKEKENEKARTPDK